MVYVRQSKQVKAAEWCETNIGNRWVATEDRAGKWACFWRGFWHREFTYEFVFVDPHDALRFALIFGS